MVLFIADMFPSTRQQIEQNAEQVEHAERRATAVEQQVDRSLGKVGPE